MAGLGAVVASGALNHLSLQSNRARAACPLTFAVPIPFRLPCSMLAVYVGVISPSLPGALIHDPVGRLSVSGGGLGGLLADLGCSSGRGRIVFLFSCCGWCGDLPDWVAGLRIKAFEDPSRKTPSFIC